MIDALFNSVLLKYKRVSVGKQTKFIGKLVIRGRGTIVIGKNCKIVSSGYENPTCGGIKTKLNCFDDAKLIIGNNVGISNSCINAFKSIEIGNDVLIGDNCVITDTDFHPILPKDRKDNNTKEIKTKKVVISDNVFIGGRCIILKGVTIGQNSVIGAGSVVTCDIPQDQVWAGNPAHFIKSIIYYDNENNE